MIEMNQQKNVTKVAQRIYGRKIKTKNWWKADVFWDIFWK